MRTTLDLDDRLMESLMARHPGESKTKAVEAAISEHLRRAAVDWLLQNAGTIEIDDLSGELGRSTGGSMSSESSATRPSR
jgi:hypothetical protein